VLEPERSSGCAHALEARPDCCVAQVRSVLYDEPSRVHYDSGWPHYSG
jgi:hypothetical protein